MQYCVPQNPVQTVPWTMAGKGLPSLSVELPVWISLINKRLLSVLLKHPKWDILEIHLMVPCKVFLH